MGPNDNLQISNSTYDCDTPQPFKIFLATLWYFSQSAPSSKKKNIKNNLEIKNPYSKDDIIKTDPDPRLKAEGKAGQTVEMGVIFLMSQNFSPEPGSEWIVGTCFKSPCVAAGNNELTSIYR